MRCWVSSPLSTARCYGIDASASLPGRPLVCHAVPATAATVSPPGNQTMVAGAAENTAEWQQCWTRRLLPCWRLASGNALRSRNRWWQLADRGRPHPWRPYAYSQLTNPYWTLGFQDNDAANLHAPVEFRYPYFDIRLVRYLLRVPVLPWCWGKALLREAMWGRLPEIVRARPKKALAGNPLHGYADWVYGTDTLGTQLARFVDINRATRLLPSKGSRDETGVMAHRLLALNHWLRYGKQGA